MMTFEIISSEKNASIDYFPAFYFNPSILLTEFIKFAMNAIPSFGIATRILAKIVIMASIIAVKSSIFLVVLFWFNNRYSRQNWIVNNSNKDGIKSSMYLIVTK